MILHLRVDRLGAPISATPTDWACCIVVVMIRAGRDVVDQRAIARLRGLSWDTARRVRPWARPGHPSPVNRPGGSVPALYDAEQATAAADGMPVPHLPTVAAPGDLLDLREVAAWLGRTPTLWREYVHELRAPQPAASPYGQPHWTRAQLERWRTHRPGRGWWGPRHEYSAGLRALLAVEAAHAAGETVTTAELAHRAQTCRTTAHHARHAHRDGHRVGQ